MLAENSAHSTHLNPLALPGHRALPGSGPDRFDPAHPGNHIGSRESHKRRNMDTRRRQHVPIQHGRTRLVGVLVLILVFSITLLRSYAPTEGKKTPDI
jgi:hypothetical protein